MAVRRRRASGGARGGLAGGQGMWSKEWATGGGSRDHGWARGRARGWALGAWDVVEAITLPLPPLLSPLGPHEALGRAQGAHRATAVGLWRWRWGERGE